MRRMGRMALMLSLLAAIALNVLAEPTEVAGRDALARALGGARLPLENGLVIGASGGTPISGKYEIDNGTFQLSVYTVKTDGASGETFMEVIVDHNAGSVLRTEAITDSGDLAAARSQKDAIAAATRSLEAATTTAVKANPGYRAVSAMPYLDGGHPVAEVILVRGSDWKVVSESLD